MRNICCVCGSAGTLAEVQEDSFYFGTLTVGAKHWKCSNCNFCSVTGSQMDHNAKCEVIEIEGPFKPIEIVSIHSADAYFDWSWAGKGFGQLSFSLDRENGKLSCNNECMSRDSVRELLRAFADHIADTVELEGDRADN